ncbi:MAG: flagellar protein FlaG [Chloroflexota bacterium]
MISALTGLPPITINRQDGVSDDSSKNAGPQFSGSDSRAAAKPDKPKGETSADKDERKGANYEHLAKKISQALNKNNDLAIEFRLDEESNKMIMRIINSQTREVVEQYPPEVSLKVARLVSNLLGNGSVTDAVV